VTVFVDASAWVAIVAHETGAGDLADRLDKETVRLSSALAAWETVSALCFSHQFTVDAARDRVRLFLLTLEVTVIAIGQREYEVAADAYARFGKGRHPAGLNMGDCFAYACAKTNQASLLFIGDDFSKTDIAAC
jgi:ribonuclease VapC